MEEEKPAATREGGGVVGGGIARLAAEETRIGAAQNGEEAPRRRHSSDQMRAEHGGGKGATPPEEPIRKPLARIPKKSREKKALLPISTDSREFPEILNILHSSFLDANSKLNFTYKSARLVHNEFLEKEFTEKKRKLKSEGRLDKELNESYAFLLVDEEQAHTICEKGLHVGHSRITTLGKPSMGVYLSKFSDLLQANTLEVGAHGSIFIFKVIKGKMKAMNDNFRNTPDSHSGYGGLDPTPKHECHVFKNSKAATSLFSYRAFERTQYYFYEYEYGFGEILKRPRHVCPYAVVSFGYKIDHKHGPSLSPLPGSSFSSDRFNDRNCIMLWRGQLLNKGKLLCYASLKSTTGPFLPYKLPEKIDLEIVMRLEDIKKQIPPLLFYKDTHINKEVVMGGMCSCLYEVSDKTRTGNDFQSLLQKLDREKLALVKPLADRGFLFFYFPSPLTASYGVHSTKSFPLHALFVYRDSRQPLQPESHFKVQPSSIQDNHELLPDFGGFISSLHRAFYKCQNYTSDNVNVVVEKYLRIYLKRSEGSYNHKDRTLRVYDPRLDNKKCLYTAPKDKSRIHPGIHSYIHGSDAYILPVARAKELILENKRIQQFSPISDYEPMEDDHDAATTMNKETVRESTDYDTDKLKCLINLIYITKNSTFNNPEIDDVPDNELKRKLDSSPESEWKHKHEDYIKHPREETVESSHSVCSLISALGGQDTDLRQNSPEPEPNTSDPEYYKVLFEKLSDSGLLDSLNKLLPEQKRTTEEIVKMEVSPSIDTVADSTYHQQSSFGERQVPNYLENPSPHSDNPVPADENVQETFPGCTSPCPNTPLEQVYPQQNSSLNNVDCEMHWKLIPITGEEGIAPEDHVGNLREENRQGLSYAEEQSVYVSPNDALPNDPRALHIRRGRGPGKVKRQSSRNERGPYRDRPSRNGHDFIKARHCQNGVIEGTVLEIYSKFSEQLQELLTEKDISFTGSSLPLLSSDERAMRLSNWLYSQSPGIPVQNYIDELHVKLDSVVNSYTSSSEIGGSTDAVSDTKAPVASFVQQTDSTSYPAIAQPLESLPISELLHNGSVQPASFSSTQGSPIDNVVQNQEAAPSGLTDTALADLINQMHPEMFNNLAKIFKLKFYIHTEDEENAVCCEIKDYLQKLGNKQCYPEQFLQCNTVSDKLLIIIQNEDIENSIHTIPCLIQLKRRPCVSFAGVDSLDDLKNHTYNELFVSGGVIVSDDTMLSPDPDTEDQLKKFLLFLEQINSPDEKWQWKIHCKFQKKLKELGRVNKHAPNILSLLNTYQKKHLVEILSYHNCDSQTRQAPELDCLIKLQAQNIQQRHLIFMTEKNASLFVHYADNGIVVTRMDDFMHNFISLVGKPRSSTEANSLTHHADQDNKTGIDSGSFFCAMEQAPSEAEGKEEEDMSLDSGDETAQIEVCTDIAKLDPADRDEPVNQPDFVLSQTEGAKDTTPSSGSDYRQLVTPVSTTGSTGDSSAGTEGNVSSSFQDYHSRQSGISHFNLQTHQTFLGSMVYPMLGNQTIGENCFLNSYSQSIEQNSTQVSERDKKWNVK